MKNHLMEHFHVVVGLVNETNEPWACVVPNTDGQVSLKISKAILESTPENWIFKNEFFTYAIELKVGDDYWTIFRRFSQIREEHKRMLKCSTWRNEAKKLTFPTRAVFNKSDEFQIRRQRALEIYLKSLIGMTIGRNNSARFSKASFCEYLRFFEPNAIDAQYVERLKLGLERITMNERRSCVPAYKN